VLAHLPVFDKIAVPGSGLAALHLRRLADVIAEACSPIWAEARSVDPIS